MEAAPLALALYSLQILLVVCVAAMGAALAQVTVPAVRLAYWRSVALTCLVVPLLGATGMESSGITVTFGAAAPMVGETGPPGRSAVATLGDALFWIWICGIAGRAVWLAAGAYRLGQLRRRSEPATLDGDLDRLRSSVARRAEFRWSPAVTQPVAFGVRAPVILLPPAFNRLSADARRAVACHELLHVARKDWTWIVIEELVRTVFWFHPGVWWIVGQIQLAREQVIDRLVVEHTAEKKAYMGALIAFADRGGHTVLSVPFLRRRHLKSRLRLLSRESEMSSTRLAWAMAALIVTVASTALAAATAFPVEVPAFAAFSQDGATARLEIRLAETAPAAGLNEAVVSGSGDRIYLHPTAIVTDADIATAQVIDNGTPAFSVAVTLNPSAAARMTAATTPHIGKPLAILLDGTVVNAPTVRSPIGSSGVITGITEDEAKTLAARLARTVAAQDAPSSDRVTLPVPVARVRPEYTPEALAARIEGTVLLEAVVLADGSTGDISIVRSLDSTLGLDRRAVDALRQWTWKPGARDGKPQTVLVTVEMTFTLK